MTASSRYYLWGILLIIVLVSSSVSAQKPTLDVYRVRVTTREGGHFHGILEDVNDTHLFIRSGSLTYPWNEQIPLISVKKVALRRVNKRSALITGAVLGALLTGYLSVQSLQKNQPSSSLSYGITLVFAAAGGAAGGLLVGAAGGNITRRVIRPLNPIEPELSLLRQLEPFSIHYQQQFINRLPPTN